MKKFWLLTLCCAGAALWAEVRLPAIFSDHMVLARREKTPVYGTAAPGETVTVKLFGAERSATADAKGKWQVEFDLRNAPVEPGEMVVNGKVIRDVISGEVFLASGQSNMAFRLGSAAGFETEKALPADPELRTFNTVAAAPRYPTTELSGQWVKAAPETLSQFSAVGYFFGKELRRALNVPVGIVNSSVGGTGIESWTRTAVVRKHQAMFKKFRQQERLYEKYPAIYDKFVTDNQAWEERFGRCDTPMVVPPADAKWQKLTSPAFGHGVYWLRANVDISEKDAKRGFKINFQRTYAPVSLWLDGKRLVVRDSSRAFKQEYLIYNAKPRKFKPGRHTVMLRYFVSRDRVRIPRVATFGSFPVTENDWEIFTEKDFGVTTAEMRRSCPKAPGMLPSRYRIYSRLFNGMIFPLRDYKFSGVIWYQGESNAQTPEFYEKIFPAMIRDWRDQFGDRELPFIFCQLPAYYQKSADPGDAGRWAAFRTAQQSALALPFTAMAVLIDTGEALDIHPLDKATVGKRLAALALNRIYGKDIAADAPKAVSAAANGSVVEVKFVNADGLSAAAVPESYPLKLAAGKRAALVRNSPAAQVEGFALCGSDNKWFWADKAEISGDTVKVSSGKVPAPVKVRYAYQDNPGCNLVNRHLLPAIPFELLCRKK